MTASQFENELEKRQLENDNLYSFEIVKSIITDFDLKERFRITSEDLDISHYDNLSIAYELEEYKTYLIVSESSELDHFEVVDGYDTAMKVATDLCWAENPADLFDEGF